MNSHGNRRILLVDDTPSIHADFRKILEPDDDTALDAAEAALFGQPRATLRDRFAVDSAYNGREGLARVEAALAAGRPYAMAFVDMRMPSGWDGMETIEQLWRVDANLQVVICTAYADQPWQEVQQRLDVRDRLLIVKKPFDMIEVNQLALTLTAKWDLARQAESNVLELQRALQELKATEAALRQSNRELEEFAHSLSHDLRAPLSVMSAFGGLLSQELAGSEDAKVRHYLARIQASAALGEELIEALLLLDRVSRLPLCIEPVDLSALANRLLGELRNFEPGREVSIQVQEGLSAPADPRLAQIVMKQLLDNAWKFTARRADARIEVGMEHPGDGEAGDPVFFVRDNGSGFDMAYAGKLFRIFQRLHTRKDVAGTGAGLVTARRAIDRHGGSIWADTRAGEGATFSFTLPSAPQQGRVHGNRIERQLLELRT